MSTFEGINLDVACECQQQCHSVNTHRSMVDGEWEILKGSWSVYAAKDIIRRLLKTGSLRIRTLPSLQVREDAEFVGF